MSLTLKEIEIVSAINFDEEIAQRIRSHTLAPIERLQKLSGSDTVPYDQGLSIAVADGDEAERLMKEIQAELIEREYRAFWSNRREASGLCTTDEVVILKTVDPYAMVRICGTDGANYGISTQDILARLKAWTQVSTFEIVGASSDWVALQFSKLPEQLCAFADEVYVFCSDAVEQGIGLLRERDDPKRFAAARLFCPNVSTMPMMDDAALFFFKKFSLPEQQRMSEMLAKDTTSSDMGVRLLAYDLSIRKYLFLWWD